MNRLDAQRKGISWISFADIPELFRGMYDLILDLNLPGMRMYWQYLGADGAYEQCCEHWFNNLIHDSTDQARPRSQRRNEP